MAIRGPEEESERVRNRLLLRTVVVAVIAIGLAVGVSVLLYFLFLGSSGPIVRGDIQSLTEIGKLSLAVVAGLGGVVALVVAFTKQRLSEREHNLALATSDRDKVRVLNERFTGAVAQLGDRESEAVRIGGLYSLVKLADDWPDDRQRCIDVMCAYLRFPVDSSNNRREAEVRRTIAAAIRDHLLDTDSPTYWGDRTFDFRGASLGGLSLADVVLEGGSINLTGCVVADATFDMSGVVLRSGIVDATALSVTGGTAKFDGVRMFGGSFVFRNAHVEGGVLSLVGAFASSGQISFDGIRISDGEVNCSDMAIRCQRADIADQVRFRMDNLEMTGGVLSFENLKPVRENAVEELDPDSGERRSYRAMSLDAATVSAGRVSFNNVRLAFGTVSIAGLRLGQHGTIDCAKIEIREDASLDFANAEISGGTLDFANSTIGGHRHSAGSPIPMEWIRRLEEKADVEARDVVCGDRHPTAHVDFHDSVIKNGRISFSNAKLDGGLVSFMGIDMSGGRIGFERCICTNAVVSLWNAQIRQDAIVDFATDVWGLPVIVYSAKWDALANVRLDERRMLLEVSASD